MGVIKGIDLYLYSIYVVVGYIALDPSWQSNLTDFSTNLQDLLKPRQVQNPGKAMLSFFNYLNISFLLGRR